MKGIIRKTGEEIVIVSYHSRPDRDDVMDYVSYIDSKGEEHPRSKMNLYWDIEVIDDRMELAKQQLANSITAGEIAKKSACKALEKREFVALNIYTGIINGIFAKGGCGYWSSTEVADKAEEFASTFMERFVKEGTK